jgi:hypothetical protein
MKKPLALLAALLVITVSAKAQTTNTDCQVIGNQISCRSQTSPAPSIVRTVNPPVAAPLLTPQMAMLIAERNRAAAEAMRGDVARFTTELSSRDAWVSIKTGSSFHIRMSGDRFYVRSIVPPGESWSRNTECVPAQSLGTWNCTTYSNVTRFGAFGSSQSCTLETSATLSLVSLDRITGESDDFTIRDIDWRKCKVKKVQRASFTLIPRGTQQ